MNEAVLAATSLAAVVGGGWVLALTLLPKRLEARAAWGLAYAPALGFGLASLLLCGARGLDLGRPGIASWLLAVVIAAVGLRLLRSGDDGAALVARAEGPRAARDERAATAVLVAISALVAARLFAAFVRAVPWGAWDAVAIWNLRARMLFRGWESIPAVLEGSDYPLCLPAGLAAQSGWVGRELPLAGHLAGLAFVAATLLLAGLAVRRLAGALPAAVTVVLLCGTPLFLGQGFSQEADVPLGYLLLGAFVPLAARLDRDGSDLPPALAGLCLGLAPWMKHEGRVEAILLLAPFAGLLVWERRHGRDHADEPLALPLAIGLLPGMLAAALFHRYWVTGKVFDTALFVSGDWLGRAADPARWLRPVRALIEHLAPAAANPVWAATAAAILLLAIVAAARRAARASAEFRLWLPVALAFLFFWCASYALTPYDPEWHIRTSLDRVVLQFLPITASALAAAAFRSPPD
ncbi:MAG: hypothetical protein U0X73_04335 [Thermoanaerobaculia bacterium]